MINPIPGWNPSNTGFTAFRIQNKGRTPAQFISGTVDHIFVDTPNDLPIPPLYTSSFYMPNETFVTSGTHFDTEPFFNPHAIIQNQSMAKTILNPHQMLVFYGQVIYEDVLTGARHETRWCYGWLDHPSRFIRTGPDGDGYKEYNRYT